MFRPRLIQPLSSASDADGIKLYAITLALQRLRDEGLCEPGQVLVIVTNVILGPTVIDSVQLRAVPAR